MLQKFLFITLLSFFGFSLAFHLVLAVGGGSGGSVPTCAASIWSCNDWSSCSPQGQQTRTCTLTYNCPSASTPKPLEVQSCTIPPSPPPSLSLPSSAASLPAPSPPIHPTNINPAAQSKTSKPSCTTSKWICADWSSSCDSNGFEHRACQVEFNCPSAIRPAKPPIERPCSKLQCGDKESLHDRIFCRLNLAPAGIARELQIQYLPEECRAIQDKENQKICVNRYESYEPCWNVPVGEGRFACARKALHLESTISDEVKKCVEKKINERVACQNELKDKVFSMIKFRLYDLEQRAEKFAERGADLRTVADLETIIESKKQKFNISSTTQERKKIILDVRAAWQEFMRKINHLTL